jgi:hypothetical protein
MNTIKLLIAAASLATLLLGGGAIAAEATNDNLKIGPSPSPTVTMRESEFHLLDVNKDGYIEPNEITDSVTRSQFQSLDRNHDGRLSLDEYTALT